MIAYAITDPTILGFTTLQSDLSRIATKANMILYRDKSTLDYPPKAQLFLQSARKFNFEKILLHGDIDLAFKLKADGVHLTSSQIDDIPNAKKKGLFTIVSTHNEEEAHKAQNLGADMITYSPIFHSPNKGKPIGVEAIRALCSKITIPIIALGGIVTNEQIEGVIAHGASGFASIRYFG